MPTVAYIRKAASPEQLSWRARLAAAEKPLIAAFAAWVIELQAAITDSQIAHAILTRGTAVFDHVVQAVAFEPELATVTGDEAVREFEQLARRLTPGLRLSFNLHDPNFTVAVQAHQARLVREVADETRRSIANMIERGYRDGTSVHDVAPQIRQAVGLTARQGQAVLNYRAAQVVRGANAETVAARTDRYAAEMLRRRGLTIARTETARAATAGRLASYDQAASDGLFDPATAELEWSSVQDDPNEMCAELDGQRVPMGEDFDGLLPPAHPCCRCSVFLVL